MVGRLLCGLPLRVIYGRMVEYLLSVGANVNAQNNRGSTALIMARNNGKEDVAAMLKSHILNTQVENLNIVNRLCV
jgi:ankyrin repeat protein